MNFPYEEYRGTRAWKTIAAALTKLERNGDFQLTTSQDYVTGYLCKALSRAKNLAKPEEAEHKKSKVTRIRSIRKRR